MYRSIMVPLDGSAFGEHALPLALTIAQRSGAVVRLVHVHAASELVYMIGGAPMAEELSEVPDREAELAYLDNLTQRLVSSWGVDVISTLLDGPPTLALRDYAVEHAASLVVMSTHGRRLVSRFWLGSVADALARSSAVPILLVRSDQATEQGHAPDVRKILVALDGSTLAEQILEPARMLGDLSGASYTLLHVVEPHLLFRSAPFTTPTDFDADDTQRRQVEAKRDLERVAGRLRAAGATVSVDVRVAEPVAPAILDAARDQNVDLVAIATLGRSGLARFLLGSVADKVVRGAPVPVLLYRPQAPRLEDT